MLKKKKKASKEKNSVQKKNVSSVDFSKPIKSALWKLESDELTHGVSLLAPSAMWPIIAFNFRQVALFAVSPVSAVTVCFLVSGAVRTVPTLCPLSAVAYNFCRFLADKTWPAFGGEGVGPAVEVPGTSERIYTRLICRPVSWQPESPSPCFER